MGTRADYYVGKGENAEWLGSTAYDGYPSGVPADLVKAKTEQEYRELVETILSTYDHATRPADGWPWPWEDSRTTDYAYTFDEEGVWVSGFGRLYITVNEYINNKDKIDYYDQLKEQIFPDMTSRKKVTLGPRSGLMVFSPRFDVGDE